MSDGLVLAADVGATNTRLRLSASTPLGVSTVAETTARSGDAAEIKARISDFAWTTVSSIRAKASPTRAKASPIRAIAVGLPGKISPDRRSCAISYLDPDRYVSFEDLFEDLGVEKGVLLNDLECGVLGAQEEIDERLELLCGDRNAARQEQSSFVLGMPGTGLGIGLTLGSSYPIPSEGGNILAAIDPQDELEGWIARSLAGGNGSGPGKPGIPTYQHLLRGGAIPRIFRSILQYEQDAAGLGSLDEDQPEEVVSWAFSAAAPHHAHAQATFRYYGRFLGRMMQSVALSFLPDAVYLGGSIVLSTHRLFNEDFVGEFQRHPVHGELLETLPVYVVCNAELNLDGATRKAISLIT